MMPSQKWAVHMPRLLTQYLTTWVHNLFFNQELMTTNTDYKKYRDQCEQISATN